MTHKTKINALCAILVAALTLSAQAQVQTTNQGKAMASRQKDASVSNQSVFPYVVAGINLKTTAATNILVIPKNVNGFVCQRIVVETTAVSAITTGASFSVGSTGTNATSLLASTTLSSAPTVGSYDSYNPKLAASVIAPGDIITFTVGTAATGTSQTARVHLVGYLF